MSHARIAFIQPPRGARTEIFSLQPGSRLRSSTTRASPCCAAIIWRSFSSAAPESSFSRISLRAASGVSATRDAISISSPRLNTTSFSAPPFSPRSMRTASSTSSALPMYMPSGWFMSVTSAATLRPAWQPMCTMSRASLRASSSRSISAPEPLFTSSTIARVPAASFLDSTDDTISGSESTVPVTSRRAYSRLSAGARCALCPATAQPTRCTIDMNSCGSS